MVPCQPQKPYQTTKLIPKKKKKKKNKDPDRDLGSPAVIFIPVKQKNEWV